jgi:hypothetical protein
MILRSIAILLMSPLNIIQQRYIYWNYLTVCIVSLYNLSLCILLLYIHCYDFAPCGTLIEIKISFFLPYTLNSYVFSRYSPHFLFQINITMIINMIYEYYYSGPDLRGAGTNAVLCKTCSVLMCVLEQSIIDNSSVGPLSVGPNWEGGVHTTSAFTKQYMLFIALFLYSDRLQRWCNGQRSGQTKNYKLVFVDSAIRTQLRRKLTRNQSGKCVRVGRHFYLRTVDSVS